MLPGKINKSSAQWMFVYHFHRCDSGLSERSGSAHELWLKSNFVIANIHDNHIKWPFVWTFVFIDRNKITFTGRRHQFNTVQFGEIVFKSF